MKEETKIRSFEDIKKECNISLRSRIDDLKNILQSLGSVAVSFSGGVDSSVLLLASVDSLGAGTIAITAFSEIVPSKDLREAKKIASIIGCKHIVIRTHQLTNEDFVRNDPQRCYHCKREAFSLIKTEARKRGKQIVVEGSTTTDLGDFRPGEKALRELGIISPLRQAGLSKQDVREIAKLAGLPNWQRPPNSCLATRIVFGDRITSEILDRIERMENLLSELGFHEHRARCHGNLLRIEVEICRIQELLDPKQRDRIIQMARTLGFKFVTVDLQGYRTGSMNP
ncbi:MAG: ATP-dependent sacrificial sulfur transferase LarE [bacterium]